jgi:transcriptional regulator with XRE-family HTH domain
MKNDTNINGVHEYTKESEVFGTHIKKLREYNKLSFEDIESISGISQNYIRSLEKGESSVPSNSDIKKLAEVYKVDPSTLLSIANIVVHDED